MLYFIFYFKFIYFLKKSLEVLGLEPLPKITIKAEELPYEMERNIITRHIFSFLLTHWGYILYIRYVYDALSQLQLLLLLLHVFVIFLFFRSHCLTTGVRKGDIITNMRFQKKQVYGIAYLYVVNVPILNERNIYQFRL